MLPLKKISVVLASATFALLGSVGKAQASNLITNGGFENPVIPYGSFSSFNPSIPGWTLGAGSQGSINNNYQPTIEVQNHVAGNPYEGNQFVELDSYGITKIYQNIATTPGQKYKLEFAFSPRPGVADNRLNINWDGSLIAQLSASGVGNNDTNWTTYSYNVFATGANTILSFDNLNEFSNQLGSYIDDVRLTAVPEPATIIGLLGISVFGVNSLRKRKQ